MQQKDSVARIINMTLRVSHFVHLVAPPSKCRRMHLLAGAATLRPTSWRNPPPCPQGLLPHQEVVPHRLLLRMGEDSQEIGSYERVYDESALDQVVSRRMEQKTKHKQESHASRDRDYLEYNRTIPPNQTCPKSSPLEPSQAEERLRVPLLQPPPPYCPMLPPGWKALAARAPSSPYTVPFLLSPSGKRFFSVGEAVSHLVNPPQLEEQKMEVEMSAGDRRQTRKMLTKRHPRTSLWRRTLMQNTERRAVAEMDAFEPCWENDDPSPEPYWDTLSFEIVLEGLNPLFRDNNELPLEINNNRGK